MKNSNSQNSSDSTIEKKNTELNKLRLVFEQTPGAIFILDHEFRFEYVNPGYEKLSGFSKAELIGKSVGEIFSQKDYTEPRKEIIQSMLAGQKWEGEMQTYKKDGSTYWATVVSSPFRNDEGQLEGYIIIQQDITDRKNIEISLRESEAKYKTLVENSQDGIIIVRDNKVLYANDTICKLLGHCIEGLNAEAIIHPQDIYKVTAIAIRRRNHDFSTINESFRMISKNGDIKDCDTTSTLIQFGGQWVSFFTVHDLTESKQMQHELRRSEQKYRELTEMLPLTVYELNADNVPTYINKAGRELFGLNSTNSGNNAMSFFVPNDRDRMKDILKNEKQKAENLFDAVNPDPSDPAEYTIQKPGGTTIPVLIYGTAIVENGKPVGSRGVIVDISERKAMENALRESEQKYRELADFLPQTVYELDINGNLLYVNKSGMEIMGVSEADYGKSVLQFFIPEDQERMAENLKAGAREKRPNAMNEYTALRDDGKKFPVLIYALSVLKEGKPIGTRGIIIDISERKVMENALRESEEKYKTLIENSQDGIFAIVEDKILFANNTFCKMVGYTPEELYDKSAVSLVHPDDRERGLAISELRKQGNHSTINDIFRFAAKDGSIKEGDVFSSVLELNGLIVSYITVHDLTETRKIQEALSKSEQKYRELAEMLPQTVYELDLKANLKYLNKAGREKFGIAYETSDISVFSIVIPEELEQMKKNFSNVSFKNIPSKGNFYKLRQVDGQIFEAMISATPMVIDGKTVGSRGVVIDITDRIKIENELQFAKNELEKLNSQLEKRVKESSKRLTEARTQLINLQKENLQSQYDVLKQQVNPHFLFNSLNVLTSLIKLEPDLAEKFSEQLSKVYRYVLENKDNELVDLNTELNFLDAYIFLLNIRFVGKLNVNLTIPDENRNDKIIPLAMQLLIENAIKHNIMSKTNPLVLDIFIDSTNCLNIINNLQERPSQIVSTGVGLKNILNRYKLLELQIPTFEKTKNQFIAKIQLIK